MTTKVGCSLEICVCFLGGAGLCDNSKEIGVSATKLTVSSLWRLVMLFKEIELNNSS